MVSLSGEEHRQINGVNGHADGESDDLQEFDQAEGEIQAESFFSQNPFSQ